MNLKAAITADNAAFFNLAEFGELLTVDGVETAGLLDIVISPAETSQRDDVDAWGLNLERAVLFLPEGAIPAPVPGQHLTVNGQGWIVKKPGADHAVLRLELEAFTS